MNRRAVFAGIELTVLASFLSSYGGSELALPSFGLAGLGVVATSYGLLTGE